MPAHPFRSGFRRDAPPPPLAKRDFPYRAPKSWLPVAFALAFLGVLIAAACSGILFPWIAVAYGGCSLAAIGAYGWDKRQARLGGWRTTEDSLHLLSVLGGWPGALLAQRMFRHKTRKLSFQVIFWLIVAAHLALWSWLLFARPIPLS